VCWIASGSFENGQRQGLSEKETFSAADVDPLQTSLPWGQSEEVKEAAKARTAKLLRHAVLLDGDTKAYRESAADAPVPKLATSPNSTEVEQQPVATHHVLAALNSTEQNVAALSVPKSFVQAVSNSSAQKQEAQAGVVAAVKQSTLIQNATIKNKAAASQPSVKQHAATAAKSRMSSVAKLADDKHTDQSHTQHGHAGRKDQESEAVQESDDATKDAKALIGSQLKKELSHIITKIVNKVMVSCQLCAHTCAHVHSP
jgi:hypothetical protein